MDEQQQLPRAYQLLGVKPGDTEATLNKRFRRALFQAHPDRGGDPRQAVLLNQIHDQFKRNLVDGRIPGPAEMFARIHGRPMPRPQPQPRVVLFGGGGWSSGASTSTTTSTGTTVTYTYYTGGTGD